MFVFAAVGSSLLFGFADFTGGMATRRAPAVAVVVASQAAGLVLIVALVATIGSGEPVGVALVWGAAGGMAGTLGLVILYYALATTRMTVAAPAAAVVGAIIPVVVGVALGERPALVAWMGVALALPATGLVTAGHGASGTEDRAEATRALLLGAAAGVFFGLFGVFLSRTGDASGMWPLLSARVASLAAVVAVALAWRRPLLPPVGVAPAAVAAGVMDMAANTLFLVALRGGLLSLVAVVTALYPTATVVLARLVLDERIGSLQVLGLVLAAAGVSLIAIA